MSIIALTAVFGLVRSRRSHPAQAIFNGARQPAFSSRPERILGLFLLAWISLHVLFSAVDVLSIPVFPWDAWLVWMYRAKAWFYNGGLVEMVSHAQWVKTDGIPPYGVAAYDYPDFLSVVGFWVAVGLV